MTVKGIFLCLRESRNAVWQLDVLWGLQNEPNAFLSLGSCGMWSFSPCVPELTSPSPLSSPCFFFIIIIIFFFYQEPPEVQVNAVCKTNHFFFPNRSPAPWLPRVTPLPNMHENVTVCLEAVCRACKFKPQSEDQRQTEKSPQPEKPSWLLWSGDCIGSPSRPLHIGNTFGKMIPLSSAVKNTRGVFFFFFSNTVTGLLMKSGHITWGLHLVYMKHVMYLAGGVIPCLV